jgi:hypothetical protein
VNENEKEYDTGYTSQAQVLLPPSKAREGISLLFIAFSTLPFTFKTI